MKLAPSSVLRRLFAVVLLSVPAALHAQDETIYSPSELDKPASLSSTEMTARLLARSYPSALQRAGITGTVQVQFVVDQTGKVDPASIKVLSSTVPALAEAAAGIVGEIRFRPGQVKGQPVKSVVLLPIVYR